LLGRRIAIAGAWIALATASARAAGAAELTPRGSIDDDDGAGIALVAPTALVASGDGTSLYAVSFGENAVSVFARDAASGALSFVEAAREGEDGVSGLEGVTAAAISPDGRSFYAIATVQEAVVVFARDTATGRLSFVEQRSNGSGGLTRLTSPRSVAVSPDGLHVYVTCEDAVLGFERAPSGSLTEPQVFDLPGASGAQGIAITRDGRHAYVGGYALGQVVAYTRDYETGALALLDVEENGSGGVSGLLGVDAVLVSADGADVYANGTLDSSIVHFRRDAASGLLDFVARHQDGVGGVEGLAASAGFALGGAGRRVFAGAGGDAALAVFARDPASGALAFLNATGVPGSSFIGVGSQVVASDGHLYAANGIDGRISIFSIAPYQLVETERDGVAGAAGLDGAEGVAVSPDARSVYVTGSEDDAVTAFAVREDGSLDAVATYSDGGAIDGLAGARGVTVSPDGRHVYVTGSSENAIAAFARDAADGSLAFVEREIAGAAFAEFLAPRNPVVSPDGLHVYVATAASDTVTWLGRSATTGALAFAGFVKDGTGGVNGLDGANGVALSPDGRHVYAAGQRDDAVAVFSRNASTGGLTFVEVKRDAIGGVSGLDGASAVTVSPDGRHVYATAFADGAVAVFSRNATNGRLTFVEALLDDGATLLDGPAYLAVSPDGGLVLVTSSSEASLQVFRRDAASGRLFPAQTETDAVGPITHLATPRGVAVAPDGRAAYVASGGDDALVAFAPEPARLALGLAAAAALAARARHRR
jgi:6-phosphogluconolactonase (cycloisomerase 2 family)